MAQLVDGGVTRRAYVEASSNPESRALLIGPECPESLDYLKAWAYALHGRSGVGMNGAAPLSYGTIADWSRLTGHMPSPEDVDALLVLDSVLLSPEPTARPKDAATVDAPPVHKWPEKKTPAEETV